MTRASGTTRGSAVRNPGTSFHRTTECAARDRPRRVAVRSEPPRPSVTTPPSEPAPRKPGTTGIVPFERSGRSLVRARRSVAARSGEAWPGRPSVAMTSGALTYSDRTARAARPAEKIRAARSSPAASSWSIERGESSRSIRGALARDSSSPKAFRTRATRSRRASPDAVTARAEPSYLSRRSAAVLRTAASSPRERSAASPSSASVTPAKAETTTTAGRAPFSTIESARPRALGSRSEAPPNLWIRGGAIEWLSFPVFLSHADHDDRALRCYSRSRRRLMATDIIMPQMGESIAEGTITKWLKKVGDPVKRDEPIFEISTDKVDAEIPAPAAGVLAEIMVKEGETVPVQTVVARLETEKGAAVAKPENTPPAP